MVVFNYEVGPLCISDSAASETCIEDSCPTRTTYFPGPGGVPKSLPLEFASEDTLTNIGLLICGMSLDHGCRLP